MSDAEFEPLAFKRAPLRFEDMRGQDTAVATLSGFVKRDQGISILLQGSYGSGKTTLAKIYARALNCEARASSGSPCNNCESCTNSETYFEEFDVPVLPSSWRLEDAINIAERKQNPKKIRVLFFDEAHAFSAKVQNTFLKSIEAREFTFIFATTQHWNIDRPLRSRLQPIEIRSLSLPASITFVEEVLHDHGISASRDTLKLIAGVSRGHPRDLLSALDRVLDWRDASKPTLSEEVIRLRLDLDSDEYVLKYFRVLASGSSASCSQVLNQWAIDWGSKAKWVQAFLLLLRLRMDRQEAFVDPLVDAIDVGVQDAILQSFVTYWSLEAISELVEPWARLISVWGAGRGGMTETAIRLQFALMEEAVHSYARNRRTSYGQVAAPENLQIASPEPSLFLASDRTDSSTGYVHLSHMLDLVNRASAFIQEHGKLLNVRFLYFPPTSVRLNTEQALANIDAFLEALLKFDDAKGWPQAGVFLIERDDDGVYARVAVHLKRPGTEIGFADTLRAWFEENHYKTASFLISTHSTNSDFTERRAVDFHWKAIAPFCSALHEIDYPPSEMLQGLRVPSRRIGGPIYPPHHIISYYGALRAEALIKAQDFGLTFLSLAADDLWEGLCNGWELREFPMRSSDRASRRETMELELSDLSAGTPQYDKKLAELNRSWIRQPTDRSKYVGR